MNHITHRLSKDRMNHKSKKDKVVQRNITQISYTRHVVLVVTIIFFFGIMPVNIVKALTHTKEEIIQMSKDAAIEGKQFDSWPLIQQLQKEMAQENKEKRASKKASNNKARNDQKIADTKKILQEIEEMLQSESGRNSIKNKQLNRKFADGIRYNLNQETLNVLLSYQPYFPNRGCTTKQEISECYYNLGEYQNSYIALGDCTTGRKGTELLYELEKRPEVQPLISEKKEKKRINEEANKMFDKLQKSFDHAIVISRTPSRRKSISYGTILSDDGYIAVDNKSLGMLDKKAQLQIAISSKSSYKKGDYDATIVFEGDQYSIVQIEPNELLVNSKEIRTTDQVDDSTIMILSDSKKEMVLGTVTQSGLKSGGISLNTDLAFPGSKKKGRYNFQVSKQLEAQKTAKRPTSLSYPMPFGGPVFGLDGSLIGMSVNNNGYFAVVSIQTLLGNVESLRSPTTNSSKNEISFMDVYWSDSKINAIKKLSKVFSTSVANKKNFPTGYHDDKFLTKYQDTAHNLLKWDKKLKELHVTKYDWMRSEYHKFSSVDIVKFLANASSPISEGWLYFSVNTKKPLMWTIYLNLDKELDVITKMDAKYGPHSLQMIGNKESVEIELDPSTTQTSRYKVFTWKTTEYEETKMIGNCNGTWTISSPIPKNKCMFTLYMKNLQSLKEMDGQFEDILIGIEKSQNESSKEIKF